ncbi:MAG TPA: hypothetical protein VKQ34_00005, partial [Candidatus Saccharimonadales bacterium]|nr:hypothetical protein [Candidatus Saccharimonadales bacterium]
MKQESLFHYSSPRAYRARLARHVAGSDVYWLAVLVGIAIFAAGALLLVEVHASAGWFVAGLAGPFWMLAGWSRSLRDIPPIRGGTTIDALLDADLLGMLPRELTPQRIGELLMQVRGGRFFANRFGLG